MSKIERALVRTKQIFNYYSSNFFARNYIRSGQRWSKMYIYTQTDQKPQLSDAIFLFLAQLSQMEHTGLWDIKGTKGHIYAAFKNRSDDGISGDRK